MNKDENLLELKKIKYLKMLNSLLDEYDAFFILNKYSDNDLKGNTHEKEFKPLFGLFENDLISTKALKWILHCYDCYNKIDVINDNDSAFNYLKNAIENKFR